MDRMRDKIVRKTKPEFFLMEEQSDPLHVRGHAFCPNFFSSKD